MRLPRWFPAVTFALLSPFLTACEDATAPRPVAEIVVTSTARELTPGATLQLYAQVLDAKSRALVGRPVQWISLEPQLATVSSTGLVTAVAAGTARIRATSGAVEGAFTVIVRYASCANVSPTTAIVVGQSHSGTLASADCVLYEGGERTDGWTISVAEPTTLRFSVSSGSNWIALMLTDANLQSLAYGYSYTAGEPARMIATLTPGSYRLWVYGDEASAGAYTLSTDVATLCAAATTSGTLAPGATVSGALAASSCLLPHAFEGQGWAFTTSEIGPVRFTVSTDGFTPWIVITDHSLNIRSVGPPSGASAALFDDVLPAGEHLIWVTTTTGGLGAFTVSRETSTSVPCSGPPTDTISVGRSVTGVLSADDCRTARGTRGDPWALWIASTTTVDIRMTSTSFDTYLFLLDSTGAVVAEDDDGGEFTDSRILRTLAAGRYTVHATGYSNYDLGDYTLSVQPFAGVVAGLRSDAPSRSKRPPAGPRWNADLRTHVPPQLLEPVERDDHLLRRLR